MATLSSLAYDLEATFRSGSSGFQSGRLKIGRCFRFWPMALMPKHFWPGPLMDMKAGVREKLYSLFQFVRDRPVARVQAAAIVRQARRGKNFGVLEKPENFASCCLAGQVHTLADGRCKVFVKEGLIFCRRPPW